MELKLYRFGSLLFHFVFIQKLFIYNWCTYLYDLSETENVSMILFTLRLPSFLCIQGAVKND